MELNLQLSVFMLLIHVSLATSSNVNITVMKGQTLHLTCPIAKQSEGTPVEWKNPDGNIMFFNMIKGVKNKRYKLHKLSESEYSIQISDVTFSDGGKYTCSHYLHHAIDKTVNVTVLDRPQMQVTKHEGKTVIKCTAKGNYPPPEISWKLKNGPEFHNHPQIQHEDKTFVSTEMLYINPSEKVVTVKCIVRHPALSHKTLMDFVKIKPRWMKTRRTTTTSSPETAPKTTRDLTTAQVITGLTPLTEEETVNAESSSAPATSPFSSTEASTSELPDFNTQNHTSRISNSTGWTSVAVATEESSSFNLTERNGTGNGSDLERRTGNERNTSLLVFLVTCLIFGLLVVVIFIGIKLRRAHITWKKENEDSDTSEESSKSKSSLEEKNSQAQKRRGLFNTAFTQYVVEEPTVITSVTNPAAMTSTEDTATEQPTQAQLPAQNTASSRVKETEL